MAEIPVEKKSNLSWLWWLLLLAGIIALLWAIFDNDDDTPEVLQDEETAVVGTQTEPAIDTDATDTTTAEAATGAVVTVDALSSLGDRIGGDVNLDAVAVNRVIGDMGFTVGEGANETLVRFDEVQTPNTAREGLIDVNPGSTVSLGGNVQQLDLSSMPQSIQTDLQGGNDAYIRAARVNVQNGGVNPR